MSEPRFCETTPYALSALLVYFFSFPIVNPNIDLWDGNFRKITQKQLSYLTTHRRRVGSERTAKPWSGEHSASVHGPKVVFSDQPFYRDLVASFRVYLGHL